MDKSNKMTSPHCGQVLYVSQSAPKIGLQFTFGGDKKQLGQVLKYLGLTLRHLDKFSLWPSTLPEKMID